MIQELLGGSSGLLGESKISINGGVLQVPPSVPSSSTISPTTSTPTASSDQSQNLRCPRCDSSNTKFCYYNNYNLTQPRHFCKTCRRYWTKGGALRNVPIGGGCRKNRNFTTPTAAGGKCGGPGKAKIMALPEIEKASLFGGPGFDPSSAILWTSAPQGSHLLALLRTPQNPNPNPDPMVSLPLCGSTVVSPVGLDPSSWRNNQQQQQNGFTLVEPSPNSSYQGMYQKIRSSSNYFQPHSSVAHATSSSASNAMPVVESAPVAGLGGEPGYWNPALSWPGLPSTNGAYP